MVRRLPVVQGPSQEQERAPARSRLEWVGIGAGLVVTLWLPLIVLVLPAARGICTAVLDSGAAPPTAGTARDAAPLGAAELCLVTAWGGLALLVFVLAAAAGGALVGHFARTTALRDAAAGGALGGLLIWSLAALGGALGSWLVAGLALAVLCGAGAVAAWLGSRITRRTRAG